MGQNKEPTVKTNEWNLIAQRDIGWMDWISLSKTDKRTAAIANLGDGCPVLLEGTATTERKQNDG